MDSREESRTPRPVEGVDWRNLPIGPTEAYILSRVDGATSEADLIAATGLDPDSVRQALDRLRELGAIDFEGKAPEPQRRRSLDPSGQTAVRLNRPVIEAYGADGSSATHPAAALYDPSELDEDVDLDLPRKRQILDLYYRLDSLTHYELFEIGPDADKKAIKSAYFAIVALFHPDRYFGKKRKQLYETA